VTNAPLSSITMYSPCTLFIFAHPDDDVFIAGTMRKFLEHGGNVQAVWLTSGDARGNSQVREAELHVAMDLLGLAPAALHLLRRPNRGLLPVLDAVAGDLLGLFDRLGVGTVFTTAYEGGHIDHDALNFAASQAALRATRRPDMLEFPLYNRTGALYTLGWRINDFPPGGPAARRTELDAELIARKHRMMRAYRSQRGDMLPFRFILSRTRLLRRGEPYRPIPLDRDYLTPPHAGILNYEKDRHACFEQFREAVQRVSIRPQR